MHTTNLANEIWHSTERLRGLGVDVEGTPSTRDKELEALVECVLIESLMGRHDVVPAGKLDLTRTNHLPYRAATRGRSEDLITTTDRLVDWLTPCLVLKNEDSSTSFSIYREGAPTLLDRRRPDIIVFDTEFRVETVQDDMFGEPIVNVYASGSHMCGYTSSLTPDGPAPRGRFTPLPPLLGVEVSLNKDPARLEEQLDLMDEMTCNSMISVILQGADDAATLRANHTALHGELDVDRWRKIFDSLL